MQRFTLTVTSKGQFTLPVEARASMKLAPGDQIEMFVTRGGDTIMRAVNRPVSAIFGRASAYARPVAEEARIDAVAAAVAARGASSGVRKAG